MSLINQMLKDLQDRKAKTNQSSPYTTVSFMHEEVRDSWQLSSLLLAIVLGIFVAVSLVLFVKERHEGVWQFAARHASSDLTKIIKKIEPDQNVIANANIPGIFEFGVLEKISKSAAGAKSTFSMHVINNKQHLADKQYNLAMSAAENGQWRASILHLIHAINYQPHDLRSYTALVKLFIEHEQFDSAIKYANQGLTIFTNDANLLQLKAHTLLEKGAVNAAISILLSQQPSIVKYPDYYALLAALYQKSKQYADAAGLYQQLVTVDTDNGKWWLGLGIAKEAMGAYNSAVSAYRKAQDTGVLAPNLQLFVNERINKLGSP